MLAEAASAQGQLRGALINSAVRRQAAFARERRVYSRVCIRIVACRTVCLAAPSAPSAPFHMVCGEWTRVNVNVRTI